MKQRLKDMAGELMKIAAQRELRRGEQVTPPDGLYEEFCARFLYDETDDQARAIEEKLEDLGSGKPIERLICGEVGSGKTEVEQRDAFAAAMAVQQVGRVWQTNRYGRP